MTDIISPADREIRKGYEIGYSNYANYIWETCRGCGKKRWVQYTKGKPISILCPKCCHIPKDNVKIETIIRRQTRRIRELETIKAYLIMAIILLKNHPLDK